MLGITAFPREIQKIVGEFTHWTPGEAVAVRVRPFVWRRRVVARVTTSLTCGVMYHFASRNFDVELALDREPSSACGCCVGSHLRSADGMNAYDLTLLGDDTPAETAKEAKAAWLARGAAYVRMAAVRGPVPCPTRNGGAPPHSMMSLAKAAGLCHGHRMGLMSQVDGVRCLARTRGRAASVLECLLTSERAESSTWASTTAAYCEMTVRVSATLRALPALVLAADEAALVAGLAVVAPYAAGLGAANLAMWAEEPKGNGTRISRANTKAVFEAQLALDSS